MNGRMVWCFAVIGAAVLPVAWVGAAVMPMPAAGSAVVLGAAGEGNPTLNATEYNQLRQAYLTLAMADHDYKGHRVKAMHAVEAACDILGYNIRDEGKGKQPQPTSDAEMKQAQQTIQTVQSQASSNNQTRVANHLERAVNEINLALSIK
jgi:hypothetical protein